MKHSIMVFSIYVALPLWEEADKINKRFDELCEKFKKNYLHLKDSNTCNLEFYCSVRMCKKIVKTLAANGHTIGCTETLFGSSSIADMVEAAGKCDIVYFSSDYSNDTNCLALYNILGPTGRTIVIEDKEKES